MELAPLKNKWITKLALYRPKSDRERVLRDLLVNKLHSLRTDRIGDLAFTLYQILENESVSGDFKELCYQMLNELKELIESQT